MTSFSNAASLLGYVTCDSRSKTNNLEIKAGGVWFIKINHKSKFFMSRSNLFNIFIFISALFCFRLLIFLEF